MRQIGLTGSFIAVILLLAGGASAQDVQPSGTPNMPRWDVDASVGLLHTRDFEDNRDGRYLSPGSYDRTMLAYRLGMGRYWTQHVKSDIGVTLTGERYAFDMDTNPLPGLPPGTPAYVDRTSRVTTMSGALTYQFFENDFVHPYVAGGVDLNWVQTRRFRPETTTTVNRVRYTIPALDEHDVSLVARPIIAVGCKSYFNSHAFVRPEALVALDSTGVIQTTVRFGVGVDF
jgi:hypothetical protein